MLTGTLEELSNQHGRKKIGDSAETKETGLNVLQKTAGTKEQKIEKAEGEELCQACSNC